MFDPDLLDAYMGHRKPRRARRWPWRGRRWGTLPTPLRPQRP